MAKIPPLPPARCQNRQASDAWYACGRPAAYERVSRDNGSVTVICGGCASRDDKPLYRPLSIPLVSVTCEIAFAGTSRDSAVARQEAIATLELAVLGAGGRLTVTAVTSALARYYPGAAPTGRPRDSGQG